jgi:hypothetical protein
MWVLQDHLAQIRCADMSSYRPRARFFLIHLLPFLHLFACLAVTVKNIASGWQYLILIDLPVSMVGVVVMFRCDNDQTWCHPLIWIGTLGTLWWYLLSRIAEYLFSKLRSPKLRQ